MNTEIVIPREMNFRLPEGRFRAKITRVVVKPAKGTDGHVIYIHFDVQVRGMERYECCARAIFPFELGSGSKLRVFLQGLLGRDFFLQNSNQRIDLNTILRDRDCEIDVVHGRHDEKYDWPMVLVENIYPVTEPAKEVEPKK